MNKKTIFGLFALAIVGVILSTTIVSAYRGDYTTFGPDYSEERHEIMEQAFENKDYNTWKEIITQNGRNPRVINVVNEENFETFIQAHEAGENGDYELAAQLRAELGLNNGQGPKDGTSYRQGQRQGQGRRQSQKTQQSNFIDADNDGNCDNLGQRMGRR